MTECLESPAVPRESTVQLSVGAFFEPRQYHWTFDSIAPMTEWLESLTVPRVTTVQLSVGAFFEPSQYHRTFGA
jgi:hypothetical protein